jgi:hypothetical protein
MGSKRKSVEIPTEAPSVSVPWNIGYRPELDDVAESLVLQLISNHDDGEQVELSEKDTKKLTNEFKHSETGRSDAEKTARSIALKAKLQDGASAVMMAPLKDWNRAAQKLNAEGRTVHDLARGRMYVKSPKELGAVAKVLESRDEDGYIEGVAKSAAIIKGSVGDYVKQDRSSGYGLSLNFDLKKQLKQSAVDGKTEFQVMPYEFKDIYDRSHCLYEMIRILDELKFMRTKDQTYVMENLIIANRALCDEALIRSGYDKYRSKPIHLVTDEEHEKAYDVLDRIWTVLESTPGRKHDWMQEMQSAISMAKTSLSNLNLAWKKQSRLTDRNDRDERAVPHEEPSEPHA